MLKKKIIISNANPKTSIKRLINLITHHNRYSKHHKIHYMKIIINKCKNVAK